MSEETKQRIVTALTEERAKALANPIPTNRLAMFALGHDWPTDDEIRALVITEYSNRAYGIYVTRQSGKVTPMRTSYGEIAGCTVIAGVGE